MIFYRYLKMILLLVILLAIIVPAWQFYLEKGHAYCTAEEILSGNNLSSNHVTIVGNALFDHSCRVIEYSNDTIYNVSYYVPLVDSNWTPEKPVQILIEYESGKMAFDDGFKEAVAKMDKVIDSLSKLVSNRISFTGQKKVNILSWIDPTITPEGKKCLEENGHVRIDPNKVTVVGVNEKFSLSGMIFVTTIGLAIAIVLYLRLKRIAENKKAA